MQGHHRLATLRGAAIALAAALTIGVCNPAAAAGAEPDDAHHGSELVLRALALLGVNYRFGGNSPDTGLDCSGLVRHVFQEAVGLVLPRRSEEISRSGDTIRRDQLRPGDLVFFNTLRRAFSHVGIYIGNGKFVHAPSNGGQVRVESLGGRYWQQRFNGARRLLAAADARPTDAPPRASHASVDWYGWRAPAPVQLPPVQRPTPTAGASERWPERQLDNPYLN